MRSGSGVGPPRRSETRGDRIGRIGRRRCRLERSGERVAGGAEDVPAGVANRGAQHLVVECDRVVHRLLVLLPQQCAATEVGEQDAHRARRSRFASRLGLINVTASAGTTRVLPVGRLPFEQAVLQGSQRGTRFDTELLAERLTRAGQRASHPSGGRWSRVPERDGATGAGWRRGVAVSDRPTKSPASASVSSRTNTGTAPGTRSDGLGDDAVAN